MEIMSSSLLFISNYALLQQHSFVFVLNGAGGFRNPRGGRLIHSRSLSEPDGLGSTYLVATTGVERLVETDQGLGCQVSARSHTGDKTAPSASGDGDCPCTGV